MVRILSPRPFRWPGLTVLLVPMLVLAVALGLAGGAAADGAGFVSGTEDLPLMPGLTEGGDGAMVFDSPTGRIVEVVATGAVTRQAVLDFYAETLPQLGWRAGAPGRFEREDEVLKLEISRAAGKTAVRFTLSPARGPAAQ
ncbi:MAG: hypothetical protein H6907_00215 [Hyphomicrobiales bacterium]|nr:hypothetical protein [Hyphomicrobiales bacterium]MCP5370133.1 hypothetical protein [Hyphomicrobiales bacterium]